MAQAKKQTRRGRKQDRARVAGGRLTRYATKRARRKSGQQPEEGRALAGRLDPLRRARRQVAQVQMHTVHAPPNPAGIRLFCPRLIENLNVVDIRKPQAHPFAWSAPIWRAG